MRTIRRLTAAALTAALLLLPATANAAITNVDRAAWAAGFISSTQRLNGSIPSFSTVGSTADAVVALVAARRGPVNIDKAMRFLARRVERSDYGVAPVEEVGVKAKIVLAVVASGRDPRNFGGHDLVQEILDTEQPNGRLGEDTAVFNQATALLALKAAGSPSWAARTWLFNAQCPDGGWAYDNPPRPNDDEHCTDKTDPGNDWFPTDTNTTSLAVQALALPPTTVYKQDPFDFFKAARDGAKGWGYSIGFPTDSNSTGMVIQAYAAQQKALPSGALAALKALQYKYCGGFRFNSASTSPDVGSTIGGVLGLLKKSLPVKPVPVAVAAPAPIGCPA